MARIPQTLKENSRAEQADTLSENVDIQSLLKYIALFEMKSTQKQMRVIIMELSDLDPDTDPDSEPDSDVDPDSEPA